LQPFLWALEPGSKRKREGRGRGEKRKRKKGGEEKKSECDFAALLVLTAGAAGAAATAAAAKAAEEEKEEEEEEEGEKEEEGEGEEEEEEEEEKRGKEEEEEEEEEKEFGLIYWIFFTCSGASSRLANAKKMRGKGDSFRRHPQKISGGCAPLTPPCWGVTPQAPLPPFGWPPGIPVRGGSGARSDPGERRPWNDGLTRTLMDL